MLRLMTTLRDLVDRYTTAWTNADEELFLSMVADGCVRHDPGTVHTISHAENAARFRHTHEQFPGLTFANAWMFEHGDDTITVCYAMTSGATTLAGIEVFRFAGGRIVEVWNAPPGTGAWA